MKTSFADEGRRTVLSLIVSGVTLIASFLGRGRFPIDPAWLAIALCGVPIILGAAEGLIREYDVMADLLVAIALTAAVIIGETFAAGEVAFIMTIGAYLEERTVAKARAGIERLVKLTPATARVVRDGEEIILPAEDVVVGDVVRVFAGESIAVDGVIAKGKTSIDQSLLTGESLPVDKEEGDEVFGGTVNQFGTMDMTATRAVQDSSVQRMVHLVESADAGKAKIVGLADRWATWIVVIALASAVVTWLVTGEAIRAVTILVVFCPCALVLATPTAIMAGIGNAAKRGILVRQGDALERLARVTTIAFDKTGTLTLGIPKVTLAESIDEGMAKDRLLALTAAAEARSEHPLGKAIVAYYRSVTGKTPATPDAFTMLAGRGVRAEIDGTTVLAGSRALLQENGVAVPDSMAAVAESAQQEGATTIHVAVDGKPAGVLALADTIRPDAAETVTGVHRARAETLLLTGDGPNAAGYIAHIAGITDCKPGCLPEDKMRLIEERQREGGYVCMVGDGINDAPALKTAHVGIAMAGMGSDIAIEAADIALVGDGIREIPHLLRLAKKTMRTIVVNLSASMILNLVAILLAISGVLNPVMGALVHNVGSVAVIINSSLLLTWRERGAGRPRA